MSTSESKCPDCGSPLRDSLSKTTGRPVNVGASPTPATTTKMSTNEGVINEEAVKAAEKINCRVNTWVGGIVRSVDIERIIQQAINASTARLRAEADITADADVWRKACNKAEQERDELQKWIDFECNNVAGVFSLHEFACKERDTLRDRVSELQQLNKALLAEGSALKLQNEELKRLLAKAINAAIKKDKPA